MINSQELILGNKNNTIHKFFSKKSKNLIRFVRLATHINDIHKIGPAINWLKKNKYLVMVNIMQISELNKKKIPGICKFLKKKKN